MSIALLPDIINMMYVCVAAYLEQMLRAKYPASLSDTEERFCSKRITILTRLYLALWFALPPRPLCFQTTNLDIRQLLNQFILSFRYPSFTHLCFDE